MAYSHDDKFPVTHFSAIVALSSNDNAERKRAYDILIRAYWKPVYKHLRFKWNKDSDSAEDLTQSFFAVAMEKEFFNRFDPALARFRTFMRTCLDRFVAKGHTAATRLKRGGNIEILSLDFDNAENEIANYPATSESPDEFFNKEWARSVFSMAVERLNEHFVILDKKIYFDLFERCDLESVDSDNKSTYANLAEEFDIPLSDVTNFLFSARKEFRRIVLDVIRELTSSDEEYRQEVRGLLGIQPK